MKKGSRKDIEPTIAGDDLGGAPAQFLDQLAGDMSGPDLESTTPEGAQGAMPEGVPDGVPDGVWAGVTKEVMEGKLEDGQDPLSGPDPSPTGARGTSAMANVIKHYVPAVYLVQMANMETVSVTGMAEYVAAEMRNAGNPSHPLLRMLVIVGLGLGFRAMAAHARAAITHDPEAFKFFNAGAIELGAELRRLSVTVTELQARMGE